MWGPQIHSSSPMTKENGTISGIPGVPFIKALGICAPVQVRGGAAMRAHEERNRQQDLGLGRVVERLECWWGSSVQDLAVSVGMLLFLHEPPCLRL